MRILVVFPCPPSFEVDHVCNLTDVDDKIIARMARDGVSLEELTGKYAKLFFDDLASLNIVPASRYPRATEHIDDIVEMVQVWKKTLCRHCLRACLVCVFTLFVVSTALRVCTRVCAPI